jgi:phage tail tape-measure protein
MDLVSLLAHLDPRVGLLSAARRIPSARLRPRLPKIPKRLLMRLLKNPIVVVSAATLGVKIGKDAYQLRLGEIDSKEFRARTGSHLGAISGGVFGAAAGAAALSVVPGVGTILGAFAGGMIGENLGAKLGRKSAEQAEAYFVKKDGGAEQEPATKRTM